jgi:hypothetical protein
MHQCPLITQLFFTGIRLLSTRCTTCISLLTDGQAPSRYIAVLDILLLLLYKVDIAAVFAAEVLTLSFELAPLVFTCSCLGFRHVFHFAVGAHTGFLNCCVASSEEFRAGELATVDQLIVLVVTLVTAAEGVRL